MDKATRSAIERATQQARKLLNEDFSSQLEGTFDVLRNGVIAAEGGGHLSPRQRFQRGKIVAAIEHKKATGTTALEAVTEYVRDAAFTTLNRFVALKMLEARQLVQECITKGEQSGGYKEFCGMAPGLALLPEGAGYRLYLESLFDEFSTEIKVLFDRRDAASVLWPKRATFDALLIILNDANLVGVWNEDETIGWVYQFFNSSDERKEMRELNSAPRNSRELAVRNQFFTPRYVVQFLVDNTLGRIWTEMHGDNTYLTQICKYLDRSNSVMHGKRTRKDPRDIRILDPACGSGHFLLYAFDLLLTIYEEAWRSVDDGAPVSESTGSTLAADYPDVDALRCAIPRLIIETNLYGVDIDPRCAQIAALALWLRAHRAWKDLGLAASARPSIAKTHIVVAEPMLGEVALLDEFASRLNPPLLRNLFKKMVSESQLAGELGTLLRIEDGIANELKRAREQFIELQNTTAFLPGLQPTEQQGSLDLTGIDDSRFFHEAEARIVEALREYAETAPIAARTRRQLFSEDAAHGVALVELLRRKYDVVLMNPPFGDPTVRTKQYLSERYAAQPNDLYACFLERVVTDLCIGLCGQITPREFLTYSSYSSLRQDVLVQRTNLLILADFGLGVMDSAMVRSAAYVLDCGKDRPTKQQAKAIRLLSVSDKSTRLLETIKCINEDVFHVDVFVFDPDDFSQVGEGSLAYWIAQDTIDRFQKGPFFSETAGDARLGVQTSNNEQFLRLIWEIGEYGRGCKWRGYLKGGDFLKYASLIHLAIDWQKDGSHIQNSYGPSVRLRESWQYEKSGLNYPLINETGINVSILPEGTVYDNGSPSIYPLQAVDPYLLLGLMNSRFVEYCFRSLTSTRHWQVGYLRRLPWRWPSKEIAREIAMETRKAVAIQRTLIARNEVSPDYRAHPCLQRPECDADIAAAISDDSAEAVRQQLQLIQIDWRLDELALRGFEATESERRSIEYIVGRHPYEWGSGSDANNVSDSDSGGERPQIHRVSRFPVETLALRSSCSPSELFQRENGYPIEQDIEENARDLLSYFFGVAIGRWEVTQIGEASGRFADDFSEVTGSHRVVDAKDGILVDDAGHSSDVHKALLDAIGRCGFSDPDKTLERLESLGKLQGGVREWISREYFKRHLLKYSASQRKAPIFWQLALPSGRYSIWIHYHRLTRDTLYTLQQSFLEPKLSHEEKRLSEIREEEISAPTSAKRKERLAAEEMVLELRQFLDELKRVSPLWNPSLDDGVVLTMAPLWKLAPQHKPWQKELKSKWDDLEAGKYDWAQIAMHLWPERVVPKCRVDRSVAIAHGLESMFWVEGDDGKWKPRSTPARLLSELISDRTSTAVKAALASLSQTPTTATRARSRRSAS